MADINNVNFKNFAVTTLAAGIDASQTSFDVTDGTKLPTSPFIAVIWNATDYPDIVSDPNVEIIYVTTKTTNTLNPVTRGYDNTTAATHNTSGKTYKIAAILNAGLENDIKAFINSKGAASGLASLDANSLVVQNPANATATPTVSKIPIADSNGSLNSWITGQNINAQTGTTYTFVLSDAGKLVTLNNASAITVTIPLNSSVAFPIGTHIDCMQLGAGKVTFSPTSGVTLNSKSSNKSIGAQYVGVTLVKINTDTWVLFGDLVA
jgi:hypothetical protein